MTKLLAELAGGLVVSCQAGEESPLNSPETMALMARAAQLGGAVAIRANGSADICAIKAATTLPVIGIRKVRRPGSDVYITPQFKDAARIAAAGADMIAVDATSRVRPGGEDLEELIARIHTELALPVMADVDCVEAGQAAVAAGADVVATTLSGYTNNGRHGEGPDIDLVRALVEAQSLPVIAEGRVWTTEDAASAFLSGAHAVVVGTAITDPTRITQRFVSAIGRVRSTGTASLPREGSGG